MPGVVIRDGYTQDGYIEAEERLHGALSFRYRPMLPEEVEVVDEAVRKAGPREGVQLLARAVHKQLESWKSDDDPMPDPPSYEFVRRLRYPVLTRLAGIITGRQASDASKDRTPPTADEYLQSLEATPGAVLAEQSEGN